MMTIKCSFCGDKTKPFAYKGKQYCEVCMTKRFMGDVAVSHSPIKEKELQAKTSARDAKRKAYDVERNRQYRKRKKEQTYIEIG